MNKDRIFIIFFSLLGLTSILLTAFKIGSPNDLNQYRKDEIVVADVVKMYNQVNTYIRANGNLPASFADIAKGSNSNYISNEVKTKIDYNKESEDTFSLCTNFEIDANEEKYKKLATSNYSIYYLKTNDETTQIYKHGKGYTCFKFLSAQLTMKPSNQLHPDEEYDLDQMLNHSMDDSEGILLERNKIQNVSTSPASTDSKTVEIVVNAYIDLQSDLNIQEGKIWLHNYAGGAAPGRHIDSKNMFTQINGKAYNFNFCNDPGEARIDCDSDKVDLSSFGVDLPVSATLKSVQSLAGRNITKLVASPSATNGYLTQIHFHDLRDAPDWYKVKLIYQIDK